MLLLVHSWDHIGRICADCGPVEVNCQGLKDPVILELRHKSQRFSVMFEISICPWILA